MKKLKMFILTTVMALFGLSVPKADATILGDLLNAGQDAALLAQQYAQFLQDMSIHIDQKMDFIEKTMKFINETRNVYNRISDGKRALTSINSIAYSSERIIRLIGDTKQRYDNICRYGNASDVQKALRVLHAVQNDTKGLYYEVLGSLSDLKNLQEVTGIELLSAVSDMSDQLHNEVTRISQSSKRQMGNITSDISARREAEKNSKALSTVIY